MEEKTCQKRRSEWRRVEPGDMVLLAFAVSLLVALVAGMTSSILAAYFPAIDVSFLQATAAVSVIAFVVLAGIIVCAAD